MEDGGQSVMQDGQNSTHKLFAMSSDMISLVGTRIMECIQENDFYL